MTYFTNSRPYAGRGTHPITEAGRRPCSQDKKAGFQLKLAFSREPDEDMLVGRKVAGSNPLPMQAVAPQGGEQRSMPPFEDKLTTHHLELAPAREQRTEDLVGRRGAVLPAATVEDPHDGANQRICTLPQAHSQLIAPTALVEDEQQEFAVKESEHEAQPGAYTVDGIYARNKECHHQHKTTLPYVFIDYDKMADHSVVRFVVFLWLLCGAFAQPMKGPRKGVLVSISG